MGEGVTRAEFNTLAGIIRDLATALVSHTHGVSNGSSYGGLTYGPDSECRSDLAAIRERLDDLVHADPASSLSRGEEGR